MSRADRHAIGTWWALRWFKCALWMYPPDWKPYDSRWLFDLFNAAGQAAAEWSRR